MLKIDKVGVDGVVLDLKDLAYTPSAGLRVIMGLERRSPSRCWRRSEGEN